MSHPAFAPHLKKQLKRCVIPASIGLVLFGPALMDQVWLAFKQRQLRSTLYDLTATEALLLEQKKRLGQDQDYVEGLVRNTFNFSKPDEYVIPPSEAEGHGSHR